MSRSARLRWATASELLRLIHREPGITRRRAGERLGLSSGALTETVERLRAAELLTESRAPIAGPGRPTTILEPHERGPLVIVVELRARQWVVSLGDLAGRRTLLSSGLYGADRPEAVLGEIARQVGAAFRNVRGPGPRRRGRGRRDRLGHPPRAAHRARLDRCRAGLAHRRHPRSADVALLAGNDATLGGSPKPGPAPPGTPAVALHLLITEGLGGVLLVDGHPVRGARGRGGEFGHLPLGDPALECPCGAHGCWGRTVDGEALARLAGEPQPADPEAYARHALQSLIRGEPASERSARADVAHALGAGIAGLVNAHDPDIVTLSGLAPLVRAAAPDAFAHAYHGGLMLTNRDAPPPICDSTHGDDGPARGALNLGFDRITEPSALAAWSERRRA